MLIKPKFVKLATINARKNWSFFLLNYSENDFEELVITPVSKPPELPETMNPKTQESPTAGS